MKKFLMGTNITLLDKEIQTENGNQSKNKRPILLQAINLLSQVTGWLKWVQEETWNTNNQLFIMQQI